jgi:hypothetical protein
MVRTGVTFERAAVEWLRYKLALERAGLRSLRFHDLRHTFGTRAISKADILRVKEWMGVSVIYRDAFAVLDALGWRPNPNATTTTTTTTTYVPLAAGHIDQLVRCRYDLGRTNLDRLDMLDGTETAQAPPRARHQPSRRAGPRRLLSSWW